MNTLHIAKLLDKQKLHTQKFTSINIITITHIKQPYAKLKTSVMTQNKFTKVQISNRCTSDPYIHGIQFIMWLSADSVKWIILMFCYVEGLEGQTLAWRLATLIMYFIVLLSPSRQMPRLRLKSDHNHLLPHPVQFINNQSSYNSTLYDPGYWQPFLHKPKLHTDTIITTNTHYTKKI